MLASDESETIALIEKIVREKGIRLLKHSTNSSSILKKFEDEIDFLIYDIGRTTEHALDTLQIVKSLNPSLPLLILTGDNSIEHMKALAQLNPYYCALTPLDANEIKSVIDAVKTRIPGLTYT